MTKRCGNFGQQTNKKAKLDDDIEALWGDDLDEGALDDCIKLVTQVCEEERITCTQLNNVTLLPTYNAFKDRNVIFHSTQFDNSVRPSTSKYEPCPKKRIVDEDLESEVQRLRKQYEEREGEVSILRSQLHETKTSIQIEQQKMHIEWRQKLNTTEKQMKSIQSELEFKNLEIANLKQKIVDITKHNNMDITLNTTQNIMTKNLKEKEVVVAEIKTKSRKLQAILDPIYPLKGVIPDYIFSIPKHEQYVIETKLTHTCRNAIPYLQNQTVSSNVAMDKSNKNLNYVYPEILKLMYCTAEELNLKENTILLNKIICTCKQFLDDLQTFLEQIKGNLRTEDILEADSNYLKCQNEDVHSGKLRGEIGMKSSVLLNILSEILPYNDYVQEHICQDKPLVFQENQLYIKDLPCLTTGKRSNIPYSFLNIVLSIIKTAGEIRKVHIMTNFLCSSVKLLTNICKSKNYDYVSDIFCKLTKEVILSRPMVDVICQLTVLFKVAAHHSFFIEFLLNKSQNSMSSQKGILYFNEDACRFYVFVMLFDNSILKLKKEIPLDVCLNMLCFMYQTFKSAHWIHHRDTKECECVPQLYKLEIEIVFRALEKYVEESKRLKKRTSDWDHFFKNAIAAKVLNLMTFNSYELTEKYITVFAQYKEIEKRLQEEEGLNELEKLNINEEVIEISSSAFANVDF